jgi:L-threonylcarbamoyladenylate synthase
MRIGNSIAEAKKHLDLNGIVAIPTETVYGLAACALNDEAILKVFKAKNRPHFDPLIVHVANGTEAKKYAEIPTKLQPLANELWPGPLTLLLIKKPMISDLVTAGSDFVALRVPKHALTQTLLSQLNYPLVAPSANPFGYVSPTTAQHVAKNLTSVDYILDGGACEHGIESTIIGLEQNQIFVYRLGSTSLEEIERICNEPVQLKIQNNSNPKAPGMLDKHYSPKCRLSIYKPEKDAADRTGKALIWYGEDAPIGYENVYFLSKEKSLDEAAKNLFAILRDLDENQWSKAEINLVPNQGIGRAINDRIKRACVI